MTEQLAKQIVKSLELTHIEKDAVLQIMNLYTMFVKLDCVQLEINPWATDPKNTLFCIDGKIGIDDNAKFRQTELVHMKNNSLGSE